MTELACVVFLKLSSRTWKLIFFVSIPHLIMFFKRFIYLFMRDPERGKDTGRGRNRLPVGNLMHDSIPGPGEQDLSRRQMLNHWATHMPPPPFLKADWRWGMGFCPFQRLFLVPNLRSHYLTKTCRHLLVRPSSMPAITLLQDILNKLWARLCSQSKVYNSF